VGCGVRVWGLGSRVWGLRFVVVGGASGFGVEGSGFRMDKVWGPRLPTAGYGLWVSGCLGIRPRVKFWGYNPV